MLTCLIGHRGVGKSALLNRLSQYLENEKVLLFDLDTEIELEHGSITQIFEKGESHFRKIEKDVFLKTLAKAKNFPENIPVYLSLGAGFPTQEIPKEIQCLWVRRETDQDGRIFLDRPRLNPEMTPLQESLTRFSERESWYQNRSDSVWTVPEGLRAPEENEKKFFQNTLSEVKGVLTLLPENIQSPEKFEQWWSHRQYWDLDYIELRDDLLSEAQIDLALQKIPKKKILYSFRKKNGPQLSSRSLANYALYDWAMELGECPYGVPPILSLHERDPDLQDSIHKLEMAGRAKAHLKLSIEIRNFEELREGHLWGILRKENRSFLPRSREARFGWYRLLHRGIYKINFLREGPGSSADQPTLYQWISSPIDPYRFAAVLGSPVVHSWTPVTHNHFFDSRFMPTYAIDIKEHEWKEALPILREMGLQFAAVTSPLKKLAFTSCEATSEISKQLESVNTLYFDQNKQIWIGDNTDLEGLKKYRDDVKNYKNIAVWGGGGTLGALRDVFPEAHFYRGSNGERLEEKSPKADEWSPDVVVWGASRDTSGHFFMPPVHWKPQLVIDLGYKENSSGKEFAQRRGASYISGEKMFFAQAEGQRKIWENCQ